ncbi:2-hydroxyacid dehydrogenase [Celeribacter sp. ULVN23_4]
MTMLLNFTDTERLAIFREIFAREVPGLALVTPDMDYAPEDIRYVFTWLPPGDWAAFPNLEVVFSISAGVDQFNTLPQHISLVKMVDPKNTQRVIDYVLTACLASLRLFPNFSDNQRRKTWEPRTVPAISETEVAILGLGAIGEQAALLLKSAGFQVSGWSRSQRNIDGIRCVSGPDGVQEILETADIVVCLLPLTDETRGILSRPFFEQMKPGANLVHVGRGAHCVIPDLAAALESGQVENAILDVFETEPLPEDDPAWNLKNCLITPHVAGRTDARTAGMNVTTNLQRLQDGQTLLWQVDRSKGY